MVAQCSMRLPQEGVVSPDLGTAVSAENDGCGVEVEPGVKITPHVPARPVSSVVRVSSLVVGRLFCIKLLSSPLRIL